RRPPPSPPFPYTTLFRSAASRLSKVRGAPAALAAAVAAERDASRAAGAVNREGVKERAVSRLDRIEAAANRRMTAGVGVLGTIRDRKSTRLNSSHVKISY